MWRRFLKIFWQEVALQGDWVPLPPYVVSGVGSDSDSRYSVWSPKLCVQRNNFVASHPQRLSVAQRSVSNTTARCVVRLEPAQASSAYDVCTHSNRLSPLLHHAIATSTYYRQLRWRVLGDRERRDNTLVENQVCQYIIVYTGVVVLIPHTCQQSMALHWFTYVY
jgi:hypothetical protein